MENTQKHIHGLHPYTSRLITELKKYTIGDVIEYTALSQLVGVDVSPSHLGYCYLLSARKFIERESGIIWDAIHGQGKLKALNANEVVSVVDSGTQKVRRVNRRNLTRIKNVDYEKLDGESLTKAKTLAVVCGTLDLFTRRKTMNRIESSNNEMLPSDERVFRLFEKVQS